MSKHGKEAAIEKMCKEGISQAYIKVFSRFYDMLEQNVPDYIPENSVTPITEVFSISDDSTPAVAPLAPAAPEADTPSATTLAESEFAASDTRTNPKPNPTNPNSTTTPTAPSSPTPTPTATTAPTAQEIEALSKTAVIKLNGGLGTSMGLDKAKSLLEVKRGKNGEPLTFLDVLANQILTTRKKYGVKLPFMFMLSFRTKADTLEYLKDYKTLFDNSPDSFVQEKEPKLLQSNLEPVSWDKNPSLEWCPAGHGELYGVLYSAGTLHALLKQGIEYIFVSNTDNLGAVATPKMAGYFARSNAPFMSEITPKTPSDLKSGHLVRSKKTGRIILREFSQLKDEDFQSAMDAARHPFVNANNIWIRVNRLLELLEANEGVVELSLIKNRKTVDPEDETSPKVYQIESAMGAGIGLFDDSAAVAVPRSRFLPVKTTNDLFCLMSDKFELDSEYRLVAQDGVYTYPVVSLDPKFYKLMHDFKAHFPEGVPSMKRATSLTIKGDYLFEGDAVINGDVHLINETGEQRVIKKGQVL